MLELAPQRGHWVSGRRPDNCLSSLDRLGVAASRYCLVASVSRRLPVYVVTYSAAAFRRPWLQVLSGLRIDAQRPALTATGALWITEKSFFTTDN